MSEGRFAGEFLTRAQIREVCCPVCDARLGEFCRTAKGGHKRKAGANHHERMEVAQWWAALMSGAPAAGVERQRQKIAELRAGVVPGRSRDARYRAGPEPDTAVKNRRRYRKKKRKPSPMSVGLSAVRRAEDALARNKRLIGGGT